jgi:curli biogenesis system outer membrane secretion channel CsgG
MNFSRVRQLFPSGLRLVTVSSLGLSAVLAVQHPASAAPERHLVQAPEGGNPPPQLIAPAQEKLRIAVLDFDYSSVSDPRWLSFFSGGSKGVSDILVNKLVQGGNYKVIERSKLDAVLKEQDLGASGRVDASTAAQIGRILGVDAVIVGSITQFDLQQRQSGGGGLFGIAVGASTKDTDAYVKLNVRMVNTTTAEIMAVAEGNGNASQSDTQVSVLGFGGGSSTSNEGKLLTLATEKAIDEVITAINTNAATLAAAPRALPAVNALVAAVAGNQVVLNKGSADGYRVGMQVSIERVTQAVKDPATGKVIRQITQPLGLVELIDVDGQSSVGQILSGAKFKVGDLAKPAR